MTIGRYRKKPVVIEAMQWPGGPTMASEVIDWLFANGATASWRDEVTELRASNGELARRADSEHLRIDTLEGRMRADIGDWIIRGVQGEFYPCKPDIFAATYDEVPVGDPAVAEATVASSNAAIRVTATDIERGDSQTIEIEDTYVLVTAGRCELTSTTAHANGTHLLTVKNAAGGTKRVVQ